MTRALPIAALLAVAASIAVSSVVLPWDDPAREPQPPCLAAQALDRTLEQDGLADRVLIRVHAARLSASLDRQAVRQDDPDGTDAKVAAQLRILLSDASATRAQLLAVIEPVARVCGDG